MKRIRIIKFITCFRIKNSGISPVIAILLLIVITISVALVLDTYVHNFIQGSTSLDKSVKLFVVDEVSSNKSGLTILIRNIDSVKVTISSIYIKDLNGLLVAKNLAILGNRVIEPQNVEQLFSFVNSPLPMGRYLLEVVSQKGARFVKTFRVADYVGMSTVISINIRNNKDNNVTITNNYAIYTAWVFQQNENYGIKLQIFPKENITIYSIRIELFSSSWDKI